MVKSMWPPKGFPHMELLIISCQNYEHQSALVTASTLPVSDCEPDFKVWLTVRLSIHPTGTGHG